MNDFVVKQGIQLGGSVKGNTGTVNGNATLDLSTGDAFEVTPTADVTFAFSNPPAAGNAQAFSVALNGANVSTSYDLANAAYDSVSFATTTQDGDPTAIFFKTDGTKMYIVGYSSASIHEYNLGTAWDISTAVFLQSLNISAQSGLQWAMFFKPDGTAVYVVAGTSVNQYSLSTAWDISSGSYTRSFNISGLEANPHGLSFKPDGNKMYVVGFNNDTVYEYALSTPWNISTASYTGASFSVASEIFSPAGLFFKPDGSKMFLLDATANDANEYSLSTAWDISTASYVQNFSVVSQEDFSNGLFFKPDGDKMYVVGPNAAQVFQYTTASTPAPATITYPASVAWSGGTAPASPADGETDLLTFYTEDGGTTYYGFKVGDALA